MENKSQINKFIAVLMKSTHGEMTTYIDDGLPIAQSDPNIFARAVAWSHRNSKIRDVKVALPVIALRGLKSEPTPSPFIENALVAFSELSPRDMLRSFMLSRTLSRTRGMKIGSLDRLLMNEIRMKLGKIQSSPDFFTRMALSHRAALKALYALSHMKPTPLAQNVLFKKKYPSGSAFEALKNLKNCTPSEAGAIVAKHKLPMQAVIGAVDAGFLEEPDFLLFMIENMTANELINNSKMLERYGLKTNPILQSAYEARLKVTQKDKRANTFKAAQAVSQVADKKTKAQLNIVQEEIRKDFKIDGDWLILADRSYSMHSAIKISKELAGILAASAKGKVHLVFFDERPEYYDVTGLDLTVIQDLTHNIKADYSTSIGCGLVYLSDLGHSVDGIIIVTDGGENQRPEFVPTYNKYVAKFGIEPVVYMLHVDGMTDMLTPQIERTDIPYQKFKLGSQVDYYSLANIVKILKPSRYAFLDELMKVPLLKRKENLND